MSKKKSWILICGAIRDVSAFTEILGDAFELYNNGLVLGITVSTWSTNSETASQLLNTLRSLGIRVVESADPGSDYFREERYVANNFLRQIVQLRNGLLGCPEDTYILKTRSDKTSIKNIDHRVFFQEDKPRTNHDNQIFSKRMLIEYGQVLSPGNIGDMNYYGYRDDLLKIAQIDLTPETFYSRTPDGFDPYLNEDRILLHLLARYDKRFELYYRITNTYRFRIDRYSFSDKVYWSCVDDIVKLQLASEPFLTIISLWFRFLWENMSVGLRISESHPFIEQQTLALQGAHFWDLLSPRTCSSLGLLSATSGQDHQCIVFNSSVWLHALRRGYLKETPAILQDVMFGRDVPLEWLEAGLRSYSERLDQIVAHYVNLGSYDTISKH